MRSIYFPCSLNRYKTAAIQKKLDKIKFLVLDVDGVMTDGGMFMSENGDQLKKYNTKDGMGIIHLTNSGFQVGIISSGFTNAMVQKRAEMLGIKHCYVGRESKIEILTKWCDEQAIKLDEVAFIGDDINDLPILKKVGIAACPSDAVVSVKSAAHIILATKGGHGCIREFIDAFLLNEPIS
jgi:3-deoxy-D-manno-octulosonate 8-phosphate phosphatase (KDO 8-P phosphatase)